jgi:hypothetical protein
VSRRRRARARPAQRISWRAANITETILRFRKGFNGIWCYDLWRRKPRRGPAAARSPPSQLTSGGGAVRGRRGDERIQQNRSGSGHLLRRKGDPARAARPPGDDYRVPSSADERRHGLDHACVPLPIHRRSHRGGQCKGRRPTTAMEWNERKQW